MASFVAQQVVLTAQQCYPPVLLVAFIVAAGIHDVSTSRSEEELVEPSTRGPGGRPLPLTKRKRDKEFDHSSTLDLDHYFGKVARCVFQNLMGLVLATFLTDMIAIVVRLWQSVGAEEWWPSEGRVVYVVGSFFMYLYVLITLFEWPDSPNVVHLIVWLLGLCGEALIFVASMYAVYRPEKEKFEQSLLDQSIFGQQQPVFLRSDLDKPWDILDLSVAVLRLVLFIGLVSLFLSIAACRYVKQRQLLDDVERRRDIDESSALLGDEHPERASRRRSSATEDERDEDTAFYRPEKLPHKTVYEYCRGYSIFFPYLWPNKSAKLQGMVLLCFIIVVCQRGVNIMVPYQTGVVTDYLTKGEGKAQMPWVPMILLIGFRMLQGSSGLLGSLRNVLWIPVSQHTYRALTTAAFEHVHSLSLDFHLSKRTGEVLSALNKGASINSFLEQVTFQVLPMFIDLLFAIFFFYVKFGPLYALFISIITFYYLYLTIRMAATRADQRRDMVNADREEVAVKNDSITSYETVKYFNAEEFEFRRYRDAISAFQNAEAKVTWGINQMNLCQSLVFMCGIFVALLTCAYEVARGYRTVGDFALLITYLGQLQGPLNFFGTFYRTVQQAMISGERLLELFKIRPTVVDTPGVQPMTSCTGHIKWDAVSFSYDKRKPALDNMSFECKPGTTTAFVGESGGGKSTVFRLMFRYYNTDQGRIEIDGQDVKDMTIDSVRRFIGVVPQDTILFNETIMYNLKYANQDATDEQVFEACRAAAIHDRILSFPDGYETKVGERGLRLSGGEKQRVAIARTLLKNPNIIMLDEATSALDGETELQIQTQLINSSFNKKRSRTVLIIAHRLSTITHADQIIVLHNGLIVERGTHASLLSRNGRYASMWEKHVRAEEAAEAARAMTTEAERLMAQANSFSALNSAASDDGNSSDSSTTARTVTNSPPISPGICKQCGAEDKSQGSGCDSSDDSADDSPDDSHDDSADDSPNGSPDDHMHWNRPQTRNRGHHLTDTNSSDIRAAA